MCPKKKNEKKVTPEDWGPRFEYNDDNVDNYVPDLGGVYRLIYRRDKSGDDYFIFYVGETDNLYEALQNHLDLLKRELPPPQNPCNAPDHCIKKYLQDYQCYFKFIIIRSKEERIRIKEELDYSFIPKDDMEFAFWMDNFIRVVSANAEKWGIPVAEMAKLQASHKKYMASYDAYLRAEIVRKNAKKKLDEQEEGEEWKKGPDE